MSVESNRAAAVKAWWGWSDKVARKAVQIFFKGDEFTKPQLEAKLNEVAGKGPPKSMGYPHHEFWSGKSGGKTHNAGGPMKGAIQRMRAAEFITTPRRGVHRQVPGTQWNSEKAPAAQEGD